jgi:hypothetical protein
MRKKCPSKVGVGHKGEKKPSIHMTTYEILFCHLKLNNHMLTNGLYLL